MPFVCWAKGLDPVRLLQEIRQAQKVLSELAAHGVSAAHEPSGGDNVTSFMKSLSTAWKEGEVRPAHRSQPSAKHWWKTRVDPFADAWSTIEGWLIAEPAVSANDLMDRLATMIPDLYATKSQLRTLQRRVKTWRTEWAKEMVLASLRKSAAEAEKSDEETTYLYSVILQSGSKQGTWGQRAMRYRIMGLPPKILMKSG